MDLGQEEVALVVTVVKDGPGQEEDSEEEEEDSPIKEDPREGSSTKVPSQRDPKYLVKLKTKTKTGAIIAISEDILWLNALRKIIVILRGAISPKDFT